MRLSLTVLPRPAAIRFASCALTLWGTGSPSEASADETSSWVRSESPIVRSAIALARERSATFRRLLESIEITGGMIYIIEGQCPRGVGACLPMSMEIAGSRRLLRILVNPRWYPGCEMVEVIAHELQHAREALDDRTALSFDQSAARTYSGRAAPLIDSDPPAT